MADPIPTTPPEQTTKPSPKIARVAYKTMQFFEIDLPEGADPETYCSSNGAREYFADLILSKIIDFKLERRFNEDGEEV